MENEIEEAKQCVKWYQSKNIKAHQDRTDVYITINDEQILVSSSEVSYRADLQKGL